MDNKEMIKATENRTVYSVMNNFTKKIDVLKICKVEDAMS